MEKAAFDCDIFDVVKVINSSNVRITTAAVLLLAKTMLVLMLKRRRVRVLMIIVVSAIMTAAPVEKRRRGDKKFSFMTLQAPLLLTTKTITMVTPTIAVLSLQCLLYCVLITRMTPTTTMMPITMAPHLQAAVTTA